MIAHTHVLMYLNTVCHEIGMAVASFPQPALPEAQADAKESQRSPKVKAAASAKADGKNVKAVVKAKDRSKPGVDKAKDPKKDEKA